MVVKAKRMVASRALKKVAKELLKAPKCVVREKLPLLKFDRFDGQQCVARGGWLLMSHRIDDHVMSSVKAKVEGLLSRIAAIRVSEENVGKNGLSIEQ